MLCPNCRRQIDKNNEHCTMARFTNGDGKLVYCCERKLSNMDMRVAAAKIRRAFLDTWEEYEKQEMGGFYGMHERELIKYPDFRLVDQALRLRKQELSALLEEGIAGLLEGCNGN